MAPFWAPNSAPIMAPTKSPLKVDVTGFPTILNGKRACKMNNNGQHIILDYLAKLIRDERDYINRQKEDITSVDYPKLDIRLP
ncbi:hypothetical protein [Geobacillus stearothermophilus]